MALMAKGRALAFGDPELMHILTNRSEEGEVSRWFLEKPAKKANEEKQPEFKSLVVQAENIIDALHQDTSEPQVTLKALSGTSWRRH